MNPFEKRKKLLTTLRTMKKNKPENFSEPSEKLMVKCPSCEQSVARHLVEEALNVCPECEHHYAIDAYLRLSMMLDSGSFKELNAGLVTENPLSFPKYAEKLKSLRDNNGLNESVVTATGKIVGEKAVVCVMDIRFLMGSMGIACGEKIALAFEYAIKHKLPVIIFAASGGARMQEGILSLFQMAKTSAAIKKHSDAGLLFISILTNPTTGGVTASFASLGDIIIAEPNALIGFAGPRVIEQTIGQKLPPEAQKSEYLLQHGFVDSVIHRKDMKDTIAMLLKMHKRSK